MEEFSGLLREHLLDSPSSRRDLTLTFITNLSTLDQQHLDYTALPAYLYERIVTEALRHPDSKSRRKLISSLLDSFCELDASSVSDLLCTRTSVLERFFKSPDHVLAWFGHLSPSGDHTHGARSLTRYALNHRDHIWSALVWKGKHPQAPSQCIQKPHYFCELDIVATLRSVAGREGARFWESAELQEGLRGGGLVRVNPGFFAQELYQRLLGGSESVPRALRSFLAFAPLRPLLQRLLPLLKDPDLIDTVDQVRVATHPDRKAESGSLVRPVPLPFWSVALLSPSVLFPSLGQLLLTFYSLCPSAALLSPSALEKLEKGAKKCLKSILTEIETSETKPSPKAWVQMVAGAAGEPWEKLQRFALLRYALQLRLRALLDRSDVQGAVELLQVGLGISCSIPERSLSAIRKRRRAEGKEGQGGSGKRERKHKRRRRESDDDDVGDVDPLELMRSAEALGEGPRGQVDNEGGNGEGGEAAVPVPADEKFKLGDLDISLAFPGSQESLRAQSLEGMVDIILQELERQYLAL